MMGQAEVLQWLEKNGPLTVKQLAGFIGTTQSVTNHSVTALVKARMVCVTHDGPLLRNRVRERVVRLLDWKDE